MAKFIEVNESRYGSHIIINVDAIAWVDEEVGRVCFSGVHGEQNGLMSFDIENMQKIIEAITSSP